MGAHAAGEEEREVLLGISKAIEEALRREDATLFFAAFFEVPWGVVYLANGTRPEIVRHLGLWLESGAWLDHPERRETTDAVDHRLAVERICASVGQKLTTAGRIALFVFKNNEDCPGGIGVNAYFCSLPNAPAIVGDWVKRQGEAKS